MAGGNHPAIEYETVRSRRCVDEPAEHVRKAGRKAVAGSDRVLNSTAYLLTGPVTAVGIVPYEEINPRVLPPARVDTRRNFTAGNYLIAPHILNTDPVVVLYYVAYRMSAKQNDWLIWPDSIDEFTTNVRVYAWLALLLEYANTTDHRALLNRLTDANEAAKESKTIVERLQEINRARRGRKSTRGGSAVSLLVDLVLNSVGAGLAIASGRERERQVKALVRLIEGTKNLGIEPFLRIRWEEPEFRRPDDDPRRIIFIPIENIEARVEARENLIGYYNFQLSSENITPLNRERYEWIRDTLKEEIVLLEQGFQELVGPGGEVNIYALLGINSIAREVIETYE